MDDMRFMKLLAEHSTWPTAQEYMCYEKIARSINEYIHYNFDKTPTISKEEVKNKIDDVREIVDTLFDQVTFIPQYAIACESTLVKLGLETGHLVTENPMDNWYENEEGKPTLIYLYYTAPEGLDYLLPDYLKEKRIDKLKSTNKKEFVKNTSN